MAHYFLDWRGIPAWLATSSAVTFPMLRPENRAKALAARFSGMDSMLLRSGVPAALRRLACIGVESIPISMKCIKRLIQPNAFIRAAFGVAAGGLLGPLSLLLNPNFFQS